MDDRQGKVSCSFRFLLALEQETRSLRGHQGITLPLAEGYWHGGRDNCSSSPIPSWSSLTMYAVSWTREVPALLITCSRDSHQHYAITLKLLLRLGLLTSNVFLRDTLVLQVEWRLMCKSYGWWMEQRTMTSPLEVSRCFGEKYRSHFQGWRTRNQHKWCSKQNMWFAKMWDYVGADWTKESNLSVPIGSIKELWWTSRSQEESD